MRMSTKCRAFFDTVNMYSNGGSEEIVGSALKDFTNRDSVVIATKRRGMEPCRDVLEARLIRALSPPAIAIGKSRLRGISPFAGAAWTGRDSVSIWHDLHPNSSKLLVVDYFHRAKRAFLGAASSSTWAVAPANVFAHLRIGIENSVFCLGLIGSPNRVERASSA